MEKKKNPNEDEVGRPRATRGQPAVHHRPPGDLGAVGGAYSFRIFFFFFRWLFHGRSRVFKVSFRFVGMYFESSAA